MKYLIEKNTHKITLIINIALFILINTSDLLLQTQLNIEEQESKIESTNSIISDESTILIYNIFFYEFNISENVIHLYSKSEPYTDWNCTFVITLLLYENTMINGSFEDEISFLIKKKYEYLNGIEEFSSSLENLYTNSIINVRIKNITLAFFDDNIIYNISFIKSIYTLYEEQDETTKEESDNIINGTSAIQGHKESNNISIIVAVCLGIVALILIVTFIIICHYKNKKKKEKLSNDTETDKVDNIINDSGITKDTFIYEPEVEKKNPKVIVFETTAQYRVEILIDSDKTMEDLFNFYFKSINQLNLNKDNGIFFLTSGKVIHRNSKHLIKKYFNKNNNTNKILVIDNDEKINNFIDSNIIKSS